MWSTCQGAYEEHPAPLVTRLTNERRMWNSHPVSGKVHGGCSGKQADATSKLKMGVTPHPATHLQRCTLQALSGCTRNTSKNAHRTLGCKQSKQPSSSAAVGFKKVAQSAEHYMSTKINTMWLNTTDQVSLTNLTRIQRNQTQKKTQRTLFIHSSKAECCDSRLGRGSPVGFRLARVGPCLSPVHLLSSGLRAKPQEPRAQGCWCLHTPLGLPVLLDTPQGS